MEWLNYHHLYYFWTVVRHGTIASASEELRLTQPTISAQLQSLEESLQVQLFERVGRRLKLTEVGQSVYNYAEQIFALGRELRGVVKGQFVGPTAKLNVGIVDVLPKLVALELLKPALELKERVQLYCREDAAESLLGQLGMHSIDVLLSDRPAPHGLSVKVFSHLLGSSSVSFFASPKIRKKLKGPFPKCLNGAPILLPSSQACVRNHIDQWFQTHEITPIIAAEFDDSALMKSFGHAGFGIFVGPTVIQKEIRWQYEADVIGRVAAIKEEFYAISTERKITHPGIRAITHAARKRLGASKVSTNG